MYFSCSFISLLKRRFGRQYGKAIFKLTTILVIFSVAFLFRGTFNILLHFFPSKDSTLGMKNLGFALFLALFYFVCEILPLFVLFYQHRIDFIKCEAERCSEYRPRLSKAPVLKNSALYGSVDVLRPDSHDGSSEASSANIKMPQQPYDNGRKSDVLRNDLDETSNFDIKWEPGLLD